ncbi:MAG: nucleotidyl transferase AbiEii/AbiGii toxin family protein, partial [Lachnospiraceae bacterium]|nr:nucleotidyl transferase AbiEii/AbiGii toxin family protein [Lachnospiraceae bacterium]
MIHTAIQLKAKVRNIANGDDAKAKALIRLFFMERFLERVSISKYRENFILKGGMLVSSLLGV